MPLEMFTMPPQLQQLVLILMLLKIQLTNLLIMQVNGLEQSLMPLEISQKVLISKEPETPQETSSNKLILKEPETPQETSSNKLILKEPETPQETSSNKQISKALETPQETSSNKQISKVQETLPVIFLRMLILVKELVIQLKILIQRVQEMPLATFSRMLILVKEPANLLKELENELVIQQKTSIQVLSPRSLEELLKSFKINWGTLTSVKLLITSKKLLEFDDCLEQRSF